MAVLTIYTPEEAPEQVKGKAATHTPRITAPERVKAGEPFTVTIEVGPHPMEDAHHIAFIEVYFEEEGRTFNPIYVAKVELTPGYSEPKATITMKLSKSGTIIAVAYCNLHGLWAARREVKVE